MIAWLRDGVQRAARWLIADVDVYDDEPRDWDIAELFEPPRTRDRYTVPINPGPDWWPVNPPKGTPPA